MIGFNPCRPCCKVLTIRARIGACFTKNRVGNPEFPYESIRAEFFDDDDNSVFVIEDEYDEKTFEMPIGYKGKIRSIATGTSSKEEDFEVEQTFGDLSRVLIINAFETENFVCCGKTWVPKKIKINIIHDFNQDQDALIEGNHVDEYYDNPIYGGWAITTDVSIERLLQSSFVIEYGDNGWQPELLEYFSVDFKEVVDSSYYNYTEGTWGAKTRVGTKEFSYTQYIQFGFGFCGRILGVFGQYPSDTDMPMARENFKFDIEVTNISYDTFISDAISLNDAYPTSFPLMAGGADWYKRNLPLNFYAGTIKIGFS